MATKNNTDRNNVLNVQIGLRLGHAFLYCLRPHSAISGPLCSFRCSE